MKAYPRRNFSLPIIAWTMMFCLTVWVPLVLAQPLKVVASFSILGDLVREVGGSDIDLTVLIGPNGDAHTYEPTVLDAKHLVQAQMLVVNGLHFENWIDRLMDGSGFKGKTIIASTGVIPLQLNEDTHQHTDSPHHHDSNNHHHHDIDPHAWQDLSNTVIYVRNVTQALVQLDPAHATAYQTRALAYIARLEALDKKTKAIFNAIPLDKRKVATTHDAFGYFAKAYGVKFISVLAGTAHHEPSAADVARVIKQIRHEKVHALFIENIVDSRLIQQIARETKIKIGKDAILYSDALSPVGESGSTYVDLFEWNVLQLATALQ